MPLAIQNGWTNFFAFWGCVLLLFFILCQVGWVLGWRWVDWIIDKLAGS